MEGPRDHASARRGLAADDEECLLELPQVRRRGLDDDPIERQPCGRQRGRVHVMPSRGCRTSEYAPEGTAEAKDPRAAVMDVDVRLT